MPWSYTRVRRTRRQDGDRARSLRWSSIGLGTRGCVTLGCGMWRMGGLEMVNRNVVGSKLADLAARVVRVRKHARSSVDELELSPDALDLVAFNLMLSVQICADIASHIIADSEWPAARTLGEAFSTLHDRAIINARTAQALSRTVGLRNVVAHGYASIDVALVHTAATQGLGDLDAFAREVSTWLLGQP